MFHTPAHKQSTTLVDLRAALAGAGLSVNRIKALSTDTSLMRVETLRPAFKIPPAGVRVRLGDLLKSRHLYAIGVGHGWSIEVDANNRDHAARIAEREGYTVHDVNMIG